MAGKNNNGYGGKNSPSLTNQNEGSAAQSQKATTASIPVPPVEDLSNFLVASSQPDQKARRQLNIPEKISDLISLPDGRDYLTFRDTEFYDQFAQESHDSNKWPDPYFGASENDLIKVCVYGNEGGLLKQEYLTKDNPLFDIQLANGQVMTSSYGTPLVVKFDHGKFLRDLGYRKGQFKIKLEFLRLQAGSPFPLLVNDKEKIYIGEFTQGEDNFIYASSDHPDSGTNENDKLYVKENKFIVTAISSDRTEAIIAPNFIDDENYLENFRMAAYSCLNVFPELGPDGLPISATFEDADSKFMTIASDAELPQSYINGKIRINNAYLIEKRVIPAIEGDLTVVPEIEIDTLRPNLIAGTNLDNRYGWTGHGSWPNPDVVINGARAVELESVEGMNNPVGIFTTKATVTNALNLTPTFLDEIGYSENAIVRTNLAVLLNPAKKLPESVPIDGTTFTFSIFIKSTAGFKHRLQAHSGPWVRNHSGNTATSPIKVSTGKWERLVFTFQMNSEHITDRIQLRLVTDPTGIIDPAAGEFLGTSWLMAGAQLEVGSEASKFTREQIGGDLTYERPLNGSIKYENPEDQNDRILIADFPDGGQKFSENMIGGTITINNGIAINDFSNVSMTTEADTGELWAPDITAADGDYGTPGGLNGTYNWNTSLHMRAIRVQDDFGQRVWSDGIKYFNNDSKSNHPGTTGMGYHAQWLKGEGPQGEPCMYFPDINYQDYILDEMKETVEDITQDPSISPYLLNGEADPRFDNQITLSEGFKQREMYISTLHPDTYGGGLAPLASYGVKAGDTIKISWQQKSRPTDFDDGKRKGASVRFYKYTRLQPPAPPDTEPTVKVQDVLDEMQRMYPIIKQNTNNFNNMREVLDDSSVVSGSNIDAQEDEVLTALQNGWVVFNSAADGYNKPTDPPILPEPEPPEPPPPPPVAPNYRTSPIQASDKAVGTIIGGPEDPWIVKSRQVTYTSPPNEGGISYENYWGLDDDRLLTLQDIGYEWIGDDDGFWRYTAPGDTTPFAEQPGPLVKPVTLTVNQNHPDVISGQISPSDLKSFAFGWRYVNNRWVPNHVHAYTATGDYDREAYFIRFSQGAQKLVARYGEVYPAHDTLIEGEKLYSDDGIWVWGAYGWEIAQEEANEPQYKWTHSTDADGSGSPYASVTTRCEEFDEWESAEYQFVVQPWFALEKKCQIQIRGDHGDVGELWVANVKMEVVRTNDEKLFYVKDAEYANLELEIEDVLDPNRIKVTKTYDQANSDQGGVPSNLAISEYTPYESGFDVQFIAQEESDEPIYARYEGKILNVQNVDGLRRIVVDKSYNEYGNDIDAILTGPESIQPYIPSAMTPWRDYFIRHRIKDADNLYTYLQFNDDIKGLITNFKPINNNEYPGSIAYKFIEPLDDSIQPLDMAFIGYEVTPSVMETVELIPFNDELIPDTVLRVPFFQDKESPIRVRETEYKSHTDIVGTGKEVREKLEDRLISGSLETANINIDFNRWKNFVHFGSAKQRLINFKRKLTQIEEYTNRSQSLLGLSAVEGYLKNAANKAVSGSADQVHTWEVSRREVINTFDEFENYMYFESSSYVTSSNGEFYDNAAPKRTGDGTLTNPYILHSVTSSQFTTWYDNNVLTASVYDRGNVNRLINLLPEHITYDKDNIEFLRFMDMIGHHYDHVWTHIRALTDVHDRTEDITKGISQALVEPVAKSLGFNLKEGRDLVKLPQYHLGLAESGSNTGIYNVRFTKKSQKDVTREIWNRLLASSPYLLKSKGTKQGLKGVIAAFGIPTSILRIQEYGGPRISGEPDFEIKQRFTKAVDFQGSEYIESPWYYTGNDRSPDTIEFRFKAKKEDDMFLAAKHKTSAGDLEASIFLKNVSGSDGKGQITFMLSDYGAGATERSMSLAAQPVYNGEYWSVMLRRRSHLSNISGLTSSFSDQVISSSNAATQSYDLYAGYYDSGIDEIIVKQSGSMTVTGSLNENYYATGSGVNNRWYIGGRAANTNSTGINMLSGSIMEWRYWNTPLTASAFWNHVAAPKAVNGNHVSSSFYDMDLRFSMDDNANLNSTPNIIKDYSLTGGQLYATASGFPDRLNFSNVSDRQKAFIPKIGLNKMSNKLRIENSILKAPDGTLANLSTTERVEVSTFDTAGLDSNKLGIFFAPTDVINEDIMLSLADMDFGSYLGDPRDTYEDRYTFGRFDRVADTYWQKWTTKQGFWDYVKLIKYYDLSLFDILRSMSPGRAKKNLGLLFEPTILERTKVVQGKKPVFEDLKSKAILDTDTYSATGSREFSRGTVNAYQYEYTASNKDVPIAHYTADMASATPTGSQLDRTGRIEEFSYFMTGSNALFRSAVTSSTSHVMKTGERVDYFEKTGSRHLQSATNLKSDRIDYKTVSSSIQIRASLKKFGVDYLLDIEDRNYGSDSQVTAGGSQASFFSGLEPAYTASRISETNKQYEFYFTASNGRTASQNKLYHLPYSSSLVNSEFESLFTTHTGLNNLAYGGCKEDGTTAPQGPGQQNKPRVAVEINEVNPYSVTTSGTGDSYLDTEITDE